MADAGRSDDVCCLLPRESCVYTACYCEENVWKLCQSLKEQGSELLSSSYAVFISNPARKIPLFQQRAGKDRNGLVVWDYHVVFVCHPPGQHAVVYDLDTRLPFPCGFARYARDSFGMQVADPMFRRIFRVVPAASYLAEFASDRSHMRSKTSSGSGWMSPPPSYAPIRTDCEVNNIQQFISMEPAEKIASSTVHGLAEFVARFSGLAAVT
ncbi:protein N-terminal glutamine amidohydrolase-like [Sycon ciliatum]|uniref:protein N-terminal glutamine amidohydrolase-like n=1 Tax=Sycon ciliatum TaxID=27933 RepID=UPI0020A9CEEA|eukprot:scpid69231/ scgid25233/ Protein N-terminal glutamine amidohydrolase; Protein NH2-terminal glutamine deamidase; WDYHV motif-containing protein 1